VAAGDALDPETGKPYDPFLDPVVPGADQLVTVRCSFVHRALAERRPGGHAARRRRHGLRGADRAAGRYPSVKQATRVTVGEGLGRADVPL
jgi:hypothetical protein